MMSSELLLRPLFCKAFNLIPAVEMPGIGGRIHSLQVLLRQADGVLEMLVWISIALMISVITLAQVEVRSGKELTEYRASDLVHHLKLDEKYVCRSRMKYLEAIFLRKLI